MTTYFAWTRKKEPFDGQIHARCDLDILELTIDHREGEAAFATVVVAQAKLPAIDERHVLISYDGKLIFSGRLIGLPAKISHDVISLEFTAEPLDAASQLQALANTLKHPPFWDPLYVEPIDQSNPSEWLEARSSLFAWDRLTGSVCVSDLFQGRQTLDVTQTFFADSLKVTLAEVPLSHVSVNVTAQWIQQGEGEISVGAKIAAAFPGGIINTLTPQALRATWPHEGQKLGRSGFWVVKSHLKEINPPRTGILDIYPTLTPEIMTWDDAHQMPKLTRARRVWMSGTLILGWRYRQKRRETVHFTLHQKTQMEGMVQPRTRTLILRLQQMDHQDSSYAANTFFLTHRGRQAIEHAMEVARAHLAASARCLEVEVMLPFEIGFDLSMDHSVCVVDPRIPGEKVLGKVIAYQLSQNGVKAWAWVRLAVSIGGKAAHLPLVENVFYVDQAYGDTIVPQSFVTDSGIAYAAYAHQRPTEGLPNLETLSFHELLRGIWVKYDAQEQIQILQSQQYPVRQNLKGVLEDIPTTISLDLLSLKTHSTTDHHIHVTILNSWMAPAQIDLSGVTL